MLEGPVLIKVGNDISTDEIMPAGTRVLPFRSNIPAISQFVFEPVDPTYVTRALAYQHTGSFIVGGRNYGQGSSREHAALAPRYLGVRAVIAQGFAHIHAENLVNCGILPLRFVTPDDWMKIAPDDVLSIADVRQAIQQGTRVHVVNTAQGETYETEHAMSGRQVEIMLAGSLINLAREGPYASAG
jgi:aconitate hydratase